MTIAIAPLEEADIPTFVNVELEAFRSHPRIPMLWQNGYTDDVYKFYSDGKQDGMRDPNCRFMKAVDSETGQIVAVAEWTFSLDPTKEKKPVDPNETPPINWPYKGNWEMRRFFNLNLGKWEKEWLSEKAYIKLDILVTHPDHHRKGAGSKLLAWGTEQADEMGIIMALEATPTGLNLYKRFGFVEKDVINADMKQFGWMKPYEEDAAVRIWMVREPQARHA